MEDERGKNSKSDRRSHLCSAQLFNVSHLALKKRMLKDSSFIEESIFHADLRFQQIVSLNQIDVTCPGVLFSIDVSINRIEKLEFLNMDQLIIFQNLVSLNLSSNLIKTVDDLSPFSSLTELNISGNMLTSLARLQKMRSLKYLDVSSNDIAAIDFESDDASKPFPSLECLDLGRNPLTPSSLNNLHSWASNSLKYLGLSHCRLPNETLSDISKLRALTVLDADCNGFDDIRLLTEALSHCVEMKHLSFIGTPLAASPAYRSALLSSMRSLNSLDGLPAILDELSSTSDPILTESPHQN